MTYLPRLATLACTAMALAACGGDTDASWCVTGDGGGWSAGYNSSDCPPERKADEAPMQPEGTLAAPGPVSPTAQP